MVDRRIVVASIFAGSAIVLALPFISGPGFGSGQKAAAKPVRDIIILPARTASLTPAVRHRVDYSPEFPTHVTIAAYDDFPPMDFDPEARAKAEGASGDRAGSGTTPGQPGTAGQAGGNPGAEAPAAGGGMSSGKSRGNWPGPIGTLSGPSPASPSKPLEEWKPPAGYSPAPAGAAAARGAPADRRPQQSSATPPSTAGSHPYPAPSGQAAPSHDNRSYARPAREAPSYPAPAYAAPAYRPPAYAPPAYAGPSYGVPAYGGYGMPPAYGAPPGYGAPPPAYAPGGYAGAAPSEPSYPYGVASGYPYRTAPVGGYRSAYPSAPPGYGVNPYGGYPAGAGTYRYTAPSTPGYAPPRSFDSRYARNAPPGTNAHPASPPRAGVDRGAEPGMPPATMPRRDMQGMVGMTGDTANWGVAPRYGDFPPPEQQGMSGRNRPSAGWTDVPGTLSRLPQGGPTPMMGPVGTYPPLGGFAWERNTSSADPARTPRNPYATQGAWQ